MKKLLFLFALLTSMFLAGCGGEGGGDDLDPVDGFLTSYQVAWEDENVTLLRSIIDDGYMQQCQTKDELVADAEAYFDDAGITNITVDYRGGVESSIDYLAGTAYFKTTLRLSYVLDGTPTFEDFPFESYLILDGFNWKLYGDQSCSGAMSKTRRSPVPPSVKK